MLDCNVIDHSRTDTVPDKWHLAITGGKVDLEVPVGSQMVWMVESLWATEQNLLHAHMKQLQPVIP